MVHLVQVAQGEVLREDLVEGADVYLNLVFERLVLAERPVQILLHLQQRGEVLVKDLLLYLNLRSFNEVADFVQPLGDLVDFDDVFRELTLVERDVLVLVGEHSNSYLEERVQKGPKVVCLADDLTVYHLF